MAESSRAAKRRAAKAKGEAPVVDITLEDVRRVLDENPVFRQAVVNAALQRQLVEARTKLAVYETVDGPPPVDPATTDGHAEE